MRGLVYGTITDCDSGSDKPSVGNPPVDFFSCWKIRWVKREDEQGPLDVNVITDGSSTGERVTKQMKNSN